MATFDVPEPRRGVLGSVMTSLGIESAGRADIASLKRGEHRLVLWEDLVSAGVTRAQLLACHPLSVLAWVRTEEGVPIAWDALLELSPVGDSGCAAEVLRAWGPQLEAQTAELLGLRGAHAPELSEADLDALDWPLERWREVCGGVPRIRRTQEAAACTAAAALRPEQLSRLRL